MDEGECENTRYFSHMSGETYNSRFSPSNCRHKNPPTKKMGSGRKVEKPGGFQPNQVKFCSPKKKEVAEGRNRLQSGDGNRAKISSPRCPPRAAQPQLNVQAQSYPVKPSPLAAQNKKPVKPIKSNVVNSDEAVKDMTEKVCILIEANNAMEIQQKRLISTHIQLQRQLKELKREILEKDRMVEKYQKTILALKNKVRNMMRMNDLDV